ncbi:hypothetical protein [Vibrio alginolyticus]
MTNWHMIVPFLALCGLLIFVYFDLLKDRKEKRETLNRDVDNIIKEFELSSVAQQTASEERDLESEDTKLQTPPPQPPVVKKEPSSNEVDVALDRLVIAMKESLTAGSKAVAISSRDYRELNELAGVALLAKSNPLNAKKKALPREVNFVQRKKRGQTARKNEDQPVRMGRSVGEPRHKPNVYKHSQ